MLITIGNSSSFFIQLTDRGSTLNTTAFLLMLEIPKIKKAVRPD